jgi:hypothetical protein
MAPVRFAFQGTGTHRAAFVLVKERSAIDKVQLLI